MIPGFQKAQPYKSAFDEMDRGAAVSVFGVRGTDVVVKERQLNPQDYALFAPWLGSSVLAQAFAFVLLHVIMLYIYVSYLAMD